MKPCSGLIVTSFSKSQPDKKLEDVFPIYEAYNSYKKVTLYPLWSSGEYLVLEKNNINSILSFSEYEWKNNLRFVKIFFATPTFDRVTKDRAAKFVDMLSAIGGTMGLLTGFSIISGVEILYFLWKTVLNFIKKTN